MDSAVTSKIPSDQDPIGSKNRSQKGKMDISQITDYLYVGAQPKAEDSGELEGMDVRLIISMIGHIQPPEEFAKLPLNLLWLRTFDTFFTPIPIKKLMKGTQAALVAIQEGGRVLTYCAKGRHRSVAMGASILIAMGNSADEAMELLHTRRKIADPHIWYIKRQIRKFEKVWQQKKNLPIETQL